MLDLTPLTPHIGARIDGLDLRETPDAATAEALRQALLDHLLLYFPAQTLDEDAQIEFCGVFGTVGRHLRPQAQRNPDDTNANPSVMMVTNERIEGRPVGYLPDGELMFHTDSCFTEIPQRAVSLYGMQVTRTGGETVYVSACRAWETLPEELRSRIVGRTAVNAFELGVAVKTVEKFDRASCPHWSHPLVARDERDGRPYLYANELMTEEIEGMDPAESREILDRLFAHVRETPDRYVHRWHKGDFLVWDNRRALHARTDFPPDQPRKLRRVPINEDRPVVPLAPADAGA